MNAVDKERNRETTKEDSTKVRNGGVKDAKIYGIGVIWNRITEENKLLNHYVS